MSDPEFGAAPVLRQLAGFEQTYANNMNQLLQTLRQIESNFQKLRIQHYEAEEEKLRAMRAVRALMRKLSPKKASKKKKTPNTGRAKKRLRPLRKP